MNRNIYHKVQIMLTKKNISNFLEILVIRLKKVHICKIGKTHKIILKELKIKIILIS